MNLTDWKNKTISEERERVEQRILEGYNSTSTFLSEEEVIEIEQELEVRTFSESIFFEGDFEIERELLEDCEDLQEQYTFEPDKHGQKMDIEVEIDLDVWEPSYKVLNQIKEAFFAQDWDIIEENDRKAKVVFNRAGGQVSKVKKCGPGMKLKGNRCVPQSGTEKAGERKKGIKLKRAKRAMGAGAKKKAAIKAKITKKRVAGRNRSYAGT